MTASLLSSGKALSLCCLVVLGVICPSAASGEDIQVSSLDGTN